MRKIFQSIFVIVCVYFSVSLKNIIFSKAGSLKIKHSNINVIPDTLRCKRLNDSAVYVFNTSIDQSKVYCQQAIQLSRKNNFIPGLLDGYLNLAKLNYYQGEYKAANNCFSKISTIFQSYNNRNLKIKYYELKADYTNIIGNYKASNDFLDTAVKLNYFQNKGSAKVSQLILLGRNKFYLGDFDKAIEYYFQALEICNKKNLQAELPEIYNKIGDVLLNLEEYDKAKEYYEKARKIAYNQTNTAEFGNANENIGEVELATNNLDSAKVHFLIALRIAEYRKDVDGISYLSSDLAACYGFQKQFNTSLKYIRKAILVSKEKKLTYNLSFSYANFATILNLKGDYQNAVKTGFTALKIAKELKNDWLISISSKELYRSNKNLGNIKLALVYNEIYDNLKDSMRLKIVFQKFQSFKLILNNLSKETKRVKYNEAILIKMQQKSETQILISIGIIAVIIISFIVIYYYKRKIILKKAIGLLNAKNNELVEERNKLTEQTDELASTVDMKNGLISMLAHDLRAPLCTLKGVLMLFEEETITPDVLFSFIPDLANKVQYSLDFLDTLLIWINSTIPDYDSFFKRFFLKQLVEAEIQLQKRNSEIKNLYLFNQIPENIEVFADPRAIKIVMRNLISNAIKYSNTSGKIFIKAKIQKGDSDNANCCLIEVIDYGIGIPAEKLLNIFTGVVESSLGTSQEMGSGMSLSFCREIIKSNNSILEVHSKPNQGTKVNFCLKALNIVQNDREISYN